MPKACFALWPCPLPRRTERVRMSIASRARWSLPRLAGGSASALSLSRPAQASLTLRPAGSLSHPRRPLSRGSSPAGCPAKPLVSFRTYRQFSGWNPPPQVLRACGAHRQKPTCFFLASSSSQVTGKDPSALSGFSRLSVLGQDGEALRRSACAGLQSRRADLVEELETRQWRRDIDNRPSFLAPAQGDRHRGYNRRSAPAV